MFDAIFVTGRLLDETGKPAEPNDNLLLEFLRFSKGWVPIVGVKVVDGGQLRGERSIIDFKNAEFAPQFRLFDPKSKRVLSHNYVGTLLEGGEFEVRFLEDGAGGSGTDEEARLEIEQLRRALSNSEADVSDREKEIASLETKIEQLEGRIQNKENSLDSVATEEITRLKSQLVTQDIELTTLQAQKTVFEATLQAIKAERDEAKGDLDLVRGTEDAAPLITDLAGSVAKSLGDASKASSAQNAFAVADAQVTLKGYLAKSGQAFKPLDAAELSRSNAHAASEISFRLKPTAEATSSGQQMPDVVGLTPSSARRILRPLGFQIQIIEAEGKPAGGVVAQQPLAGRAMPPGTIIRLTVATGLAEGS